MSCSAREGVEQYSRAIQPARVDQIGADAGAEHRLGLDQPVGIDLGALGQLHDDPERAARAERHPQQRPHLHLLAGREPVVERTAHRARPGEGLHAGDHQALRL